MGQGNSCQSGGTWEVRRKFRVRAMKQDADASILLSTLRTLPGICRAELDAAGLQLVVVYDATQADLEMITRQLEAAGFETATDWWTRLKGNWYRFVDANMRDNVGAPPPACCNKPPKRR